MSLDHMDFWLVDASSVEYLDLQVCEFQREKLPQVISSLNLSLQPTPPTAPFIPLVPVFKRLPRRRIKSSYDWSTTVFFDFSRTILQEVEVNCEEIAKSYLNHLRAFCDYIDKYLYPNTCFTDLTISTEKKYLHLRTCRTKLINSLESKAVQELVQTLFGKVRIDSGTIAYTLDATNYSLEKLVLLSIYSDPAVTDSILSYLRKNKCCMTTEQLMELSPWYNVQDMILQRPKNFLVFLNHGFKNLHDFTLWERASGAFADRDTRYGESRFRKIQEEILDCFQRRKRMDKREAMILEMFVIFLNWNERKFAKYFESMCYIWRSIPDVYITLEEMKQTLLRFLAAEFEESVEEICHEFQRRGFSDFKVISQTRKELEGKIKNSSILSSRLPQKYDCPANRLSMHNNSGHAKGYSRNSKFQQLGEKLTTNSRLSKRPEILISLPRGVFLPHTFKEPQEFLRSVFFDLFHLIRVASSLIESYNRTIQPHSVFHHNLGSAEEVLDHSSHFSEEPDDLMLELRNPFQYAQKVLIHSITENSQCTGDSTCPKKEEHEDPIRDSNFPLPGEGFRISPQPRTQFNHSQETEDHRKTNSVLSQAPENPEIPVPQPRNLSESPSGSVHSQSSEEPDDLMHEPRNPSQYARVAVSLSLTSQWAFLNGRKEEEHEDPIHEPENPLPSANQRIPVISLMDIMMGGRLLLEDSLSQTSEDSASRFRNASNPNSELLEEPKNRARDSKNRKISVPQPRNLSKLPSSRVQLDEMHYITQQVTNPLSGIRNLRHLLSIKIRALLIRNSQWTGDSIPRAREKPEGKIKNASTPISKLPKEPEKLTNLSSLFYDSRNACESQASQGTENLEMPVCQARNVSESRVRTIMARIVNMPELLSFKRDLNTPNSMIIFRRTIRDSLIRNLQWSEDCVDTHIRNLEFKEETEKSIIEMSSPSLSNPGVSREVMNYSSQFPNESQNLSHQSENLLSDSRRERSAYLTRNLQRTGDSADPQTRNSREVLNYSSQFSNESENLSHQSENLLSDSRRERSAYLTHNLQRTGDSADPQTRNSREVLNYSSQCSNESENLSRQSENLLSDSRRERSAYLTHNLRRPGQIPSSQFLGVFANPIARTRSQSVYDADEVRNSNSQLPDNPFRPPRNPGHTRRIDIQVRNSESSEKIEHTGAQPRRLLHYSRCVIRDVLIHNSQLPEGITLLKLPSRLQSYLKLEL